MKKQEKTSVTAVEDNSSLLVEPVFVEDKELSSDNVKYIKCKNDIFIENFEKKTSLSKDALKEVNSYISDYLRETTKIATNEAIKLFSEDKDIKRVVANFPYTDSKSSVEVVVDKQAKSINPLTREETTAPRIVVVVSNRVEKVSKKLIRELKEKVSEALAEKLSD